MKTAEELWDEYGGEPWAVFIEAIRDETRKECAEAIKYVGVSSDFSKGDIMREAKVAILNAGKEKP